MRGRNRLYTLLQTVLPSETQSLLWAQPILIQP
jgi:hypothetical protein